MIKIKRKKIKKIKKKKKIKPFFNMISLVLRAKNDKINLSYRIILFNFELFFSSNYVL